jgi:hypothetical protein
MTKTTFGFSANIGHALFVGWVEHPGIFIFLIFVPSCPAELLPIRSGGGRRHSTFAARPSSFPYYRLIRLPVKRMALLHA